MTVTLVAADMAIRARSDHALWPAKPLGRVPVDPSVLFAGHAECSTCGAFVRRLTRLAERTVAGDFVAAWCSVCCGTTYFVAA